MCKACRDLEVICQGNDKNVQQLVTYVPHVCVLVYMLYVMILWIIKWFKIMFKYGIWIYEKFVDQTTKNVKGIRKIDLKSLNVSLDGA